MAGLNPQVIGKEMPHGFAGCYARQPDMIVETRPAGGETPIPFGAPLVYDTAKPAVVAAGAAFTADAFVGVAGFEVKSAVTWPTQAGQYASGEAVSVFQRGSINVKAYGSPALGGAVYVRTAVSEGAYTAEPVGAFTATNESGKTVALTGCQWGGAADASGVAELVILTRPNA